MSFVAAVNSTTGQIDYFTAHEEGADLPYGYSGGLSASQVVRHYDDLPDPSTQKDDGSGNLTALSQTEIDDAAEAAQLVSLDYIAELPEGDPVRLTHQAMFCMAKEVEPHLDENSTFLEYLRWVAAGA